MFSCNFCEIFKNNFFYRTPLVAASVNANISFSSRISDTFAFQANVPFIYPLETSENLCCFQVFLGGYRKGKLALLDKKSIVEDLSLCHR